MVLAGCRLLESWPHASCEIAGHSRQMARHSCDMSFLGRWRPQRPRKRRFWAAGGHARRKRGMPLTPHGGTPAPNCVALVSGLLVATAGRKTTFLNRNCKDRGVRHSPQLGRDTCQGRGPRDTCQGRGPNMTGIEYTCPTQRRQSRNHAFNLAVPNVPPQASQELGDTGMTLRLNCRRVAPSQVPAPASAGRANLTRGNVPDSPPPPPAPVDIICR